MRPPTLVRLQHAALLGIVSACGEEGAVTDPCGSDTFAGFDVRAAVVVVPPYLLSLQVTLTNTTEAAIERHYPAGCPVRIRLYSGANLMYDESVWPCAVNTTIPIRVEPGNSTMITSGVRYPWTVSGDSLPIGTYQATAIVRITGENPVELEAGSYNLTTISPPGPRAQSGRADGKSR